jgi:hypothetical protein
MLPFKILTFFFPKFFIFGRSFVNNESLEFRKGKKTERMVVVVSHRWKKRKREGTERL